MRLNPFKGLPNGREVFAWGMFDLANQSFTLLIITLLFPIYFRGVVVGPPEERGEELWSLLGSASFLVVVALGPVLGATADGFGLKKRILIGTGVGCGALTCVLAMSESMPLAGVMGVFFLANVLYQLGENFLASFLPEISTPRNVGRVSATGWTMGYVGALLLLVITALAMLIFSLPVERWEPLFLLAGVWFLAGITLPAAVLREAPARDPEARARGTAVVAFTRLAATARDAGRFRHLIRFLTAFFVYSMGIQTIVYFAGLMAEDFGFNQTKLVLFVLQLTVTAGVASAATGFIQDRLGGRRTVLLFLAVWIVATLGLLGLSLAPPAERAEAAFWVVGNLIGLGLGGAGAASRALVGRFTPACKTAEFFGLWGMTYKLAGVVGLAGFGVVRGRFGDAASNAVLAGFFVAGLILLLRVDEVAGVRAARRADRDADTGRGVPPRVAEAAGANLSA